MNYLEKPGENVKFKHGDVVIACEVDGGLEGHGLQAGTDWMKFMKRLTEHLPRHDGSWAPKNKQTNKQQPKKGRIKGRLIRSLAILYYSYGD